jgi:hypothetical protein
MNLQEKVLYHQIHPLKLSTDWLTGLAALYFFWQHDLILGLLIAFVPSILVSGVIMKFFSLEKYAESSRGKYIRKYMTRAMEMLRFGGYAIMAMGAWYHIVLFAVLGLFIILFAWLRGIILPKN